MKIIKIALIGALNSREINFKDIKKYGCNCDITGKLFQILV